MNSPLNIQSIRKDFPVLNRQVNGKPLVYFDNAATSQTPKQVIQSIVNYYENYNSNIHRGVHTLSQEATDAYEKARQTLQSSFECCTPQEVILTSGTTHSINSGQDLLIKKEEMNCSLCYGASLNIVPCMACEKTGAMLKVIPMNSMGELEMDVFDQLLSSELDSFFVIMYQTR